MEYDSVSIWKDGVSEENIEALAEVTLDVAARIEYVAENYENIADSEERLEHLMQLGQRALEAEERLRDESLLDGDYTEPGIFEDIGNTEEVKSLMEELDIEDRDLDDYEEAEGHVSTFQRGPIDELYDAQESYSKALEAVDSVPGVEPERPGA